MWSRLPRRFGDLGHRDERRRRHAHGDIDADRSGRSSDFPWPDHRQSGNRLHVDSDLRRSDRSDQHRVQRDAGTAATQLAFSVQPTNVAAAASITPPVQVSIEDADGNVVTSAVNAVTLAIGTNPGSGTLSGTLTQNAVAGVATFPGLSMHKVVEQATR